MTYADQIAQENINAKNVANAVRNDYKSRVSAIQAATIPLQQYDNRVPFSDWLVKVGEMEQNRVRSVFEMGLAREATSGSGHPVGVKEDNKFQNVHTYNDYFDQAQTLVNEIRIGNTGTQTSVPPPFKAGSVGMSGDNQKKLVEAMIQTSPRSPFSKDA